MGVWVWEVQSRFSLSLLAAALVCPCWFPQVLDSIYFSRRFHVRCVAKAVDKAGHVGTPLRSSVVTIGTDSAICHTPVVAGTARGFQAQSFIATLKYLDVKHKEHPNRYEPGEGGAQPFISSNETSASPAGAVLLWGSCACPGLTCCLFQDPHLGADPPPGWDAAPHLHSAAAQPALPSLRVHLQAPARLLQPGHCQRPQRHLR